MRDSDKQREDGHESEHDGSLDDLMKQFQQLLFHDSSSPAVLPKSSQQQSLAWPTSAHGYVSIPSSQSGLSKQQDFKQQRVAVETSLTSLTSPIISRINLLHQVALFGKGFRCHTHERQS